MPWYHLSSPRRVAATSHRVTCGIRRPYRPRRMPRRSVCCSGVLFPRPVLRGSHLPALSWSRLSRYFSPSWHLFALIVAGISPLVKSLARRPPSHAKSARKFDKTALPVHDRLPDFPSARRTRPAHRPCPRYNKTCPVPRRRGGAADTAPFPRPSPVADRVRRRGTPPPRKPLRQNKTPGAFAPGADGFVFAGITF